MLVFCPRDILFLWYFDYGICFFRSLVFCLDTVKILAVCANENIQFSIFDELVSTNLREVETSRERLKSVPYLRLKNSKRTSKCQVFSSTEPHEESRLVPKNVKGDLKKA